VMQQGKVLLRMGVLIGLDRLLELGDYWAKGPLLLEPMRKKMYADKRQPGGDPDHLCVRGPRRAAFCTARAALAPIQLPFDAQPVEMADAYLKRCRTLGDLVTQHPTGALRVLVEYLPHEGHLNDAELSASLK